MDKISPSAAEEPAATRFSVRPRRRGDPMSISSPGDFAYSHGEAVSPETVIDDASYTLYCLDSARRQSVFVQTDEGVDLTACPFYYQGQYEHARAAIVMPLETMHAVAARKGDALDGVVMVHSVGRCGSTLLSKMFARTRECLSLSEPDVYTQLLAEPFDPADIDPLLESTTRLYFQPPAGKAPTHLVVKFRSFCIELAAAMQRATPISTPIFLYRDIHSVVRSGMRAFRYVGAPLWLVDQFHKWVVSRPALACALWWNRSIGGRLFPVLGRFSSWELSQLGAVGLLAIAWLSAMERSVAVQQAGVNLLPIRYDDLVGKTEATIAQLLEHCRLPPSAGDDMIGGLNDDSQAGTVIERRRQTPYELTSRDRDVIRLVLARSDVVDSGDYEIQGTKCPSHA